MKLSEDLDIKGRLTLQQRNADNEILAEITVNNSIVSDGRELVAKLFAGDTGIQTISHVAVGTGSSDVDVANDKTLKNQLYRKAITNKRELTRIIESNQFKGRTKVTITVELGSGEANGTLTEAGLFNAETDGVMYNRVVFPAINKTDQFTLTLIWEIIF